MTNLFTKTSSNLSHTKKTHGKFNIKQQTSCYKKTVSFSTIHAHFSWNLRNCSNLQRFPAESRCSTDANQLNTSSTWFLTRNCFESRTINLFGLKLKNFLRELFFSKSPTLIVLLTRDLVRDLWSRSDIPAVVAMLMMKKKQVNVMRWNFMFFK